MPGFHPAFLLLLLFGLALAGFAMTALGAALGVLDLPVSGNRVVVALIAIAFSAVGGGIVALAVFGAPLLFSGAPGQAKLSDCTNERQLGRERASNCEDPPPR